MSVSKHNKEQLLVIGIGNIGRSDDGLGWKMADIISEMGLEKVSVEYRYQLQVEDAHLVSEFPIVVFVDASKEKLPGGFSWQPCKPGDHYFYSSHLQSPETVLYLADTLFAKKPEAYLLAIEGENWDLGECLSEMAEKYFQKASAFFVPHIKNLQTNTQPIQMQSFAHT
jgi:hydrogenase maturation protease